MPNFDRYMERYLECWRKKYVSISEYGKQNRTRKPWILPTKYWQEGLWSEIRKGGKDDLKQYLLDKDIQKHSGVHNLKSSWILCANLYFAHKSNRDMLESFLAFKIDPDIERVEELELEWAVEGSDKSDDPALILGEKKSRRGAHQTSPDVAFVVKLRNGGHGIILTEVKFTEHSFYRCSGRESRNQVSGAPRWDTGKCMSWKTVVDDFDKNCFLLNWQKKNRSNRQYWKYLSINNENGSQLNYCPAAIAGYQLLRQQALAEVVSSLGIYDRVYSAVAYDNRNQRLIQSMRTTGLKDFRTEWGPLFNGSVRFSTFSHQEWINWMRANDDDDEWKDWLNWISERYDF